MELSMAEHNGLSISDLRDNSGAWLSAEVRQLFRARRAGDSNAVKMALFYFEDFLFKKVQRQLSLRHPEWGVRFRYFDGMKAEPQYPAPGCIALRGEVAWAGNDEGHRYDPFHIEVELCQKTGELIRYVFRFGDHRPLAENVSGSAVSGVPVGGWAYEIVHVV